MKNLKSFLFIALLTIATVATGENSDHLQTICSNGDTTVIYETRRMLHY